MSMIISRVLTYRKTGASLDTAKLTSKLTPKNSDSDDGSHYAYIDRYPLWRSTVQWLCRRLGHDEISKSSLIQPWQHSAVRTPGEWL